MFFGNDGGLWRTTNGINQPSPACSADDAGSFDNLNSGIGSLAEITSFAQDPNDTNVMLAGLGANGTAAQSLAGQTTWPQVQDGYGASTAIDPVYPENWYTTSSSGVAVERCNLGVACKPSDFGPPVISESTVGGDGRTMPVPAVFTLDSVDPSQILVGTCRVWRGPANGSSWSASNAISGMLDKLTAPLCNGNAIIRSLASTPTPSGELIYAGMAGLLDGGATAAGHLYRASWNGSASTWADISTYACRAMPASPSTRGSSQFQASFQTRTIPAVRRCTSPLQASAGMGSRHLLCTRARMQERTGST